MRANELFASRVKALNQLATTPAVPQLTEAARLVASNRKMLRRAMRLGHSLDTLSRELHVPKRTLQRHLNEAGLFFRKPRVKKGHAIKRNLAAINRAKLRILANV